MAKRISPIVFEVFLAYILYSFCTAFDLQHKKILIRSLKMCKGKENLPMKWTDANVRYNEETKEAYFYLKLTVEEEISNDFEMTFSFLKCDASGNPSTCEYKVKDYKTSGTCKYLTMKNQAWSIFIEHFDKPLVCPLKPGLYKVVKCPIKPDFLRLLPAADAVWKINIKGYDYGKIISCINMEMQVVPFQERKKSG